MSEILSALRGYPVRTFSAGEFVLTHGETTGLLYVLRTGTAEVIKDDVVVASVSEPGAIFGDLSVLLGVPHTASVRTTTEATFNLVNAPLRFLGQNPGACLHLCELLARRLDAVNKYLVDVRHQFTGHDHLG